MPKTKTLFVCQSCGVQFPKWQGKCTSCNAWNSLVEEQVSKHTKASAAKSNGFDFKAQHISDIQSNPVPRIQTADDELNRTLGGGLVSGSVILLGGEPGIGKSTLLLQMALQLSKLKVAYVSGEESPEQVKLRANRIQAKTETDLFVLNNTYAKALIKN